MKKTLAALAICAPSMAFAACGSERALVESIFQSRGWTIESEGAFEDASGTCKINDIVLVAQNLSFDVEALTWRLEGLSGLSTGSGMISLNADLENLRMVARTSDPLVDYMLSEQNRRNLIDGTLSASWDLDAGLLEVASLRVDMPGENAVGLDFRVDGVSPAVLSGQIGDLDALSLEYLAIEIENRGFADGLILSFLVSAMTGLTEAAGSPASVVEGTKREMSQMVRDLPDALFHDGSKDALLRLIADGPVPWGELFVQVAPTPPLAFSKLMELGFAPSVFDESALLQAFDGVEFLISYIAAPVAE